ncbi:MAG: YkgJ family cysteine cluster protein [Proteobacteria bacterium]|nr:YkgJ family cysteine cluster protein [Pseudomonadota bacterium]
MAVARATAADPADGLCFECTGCGDCCRVRDGYDCVYLYEDDAERLSLELALELDEFLERYAFVDELGWTRIKMDSDACPFFNRENNCCSVYEARPLQCRTFPFWDSMLTGNAGRLSWRSSARRMCEGVGQGNKWPAAQVNKLVAEMKEAEEEQG